MERHNSGKVEALLYEQRKKERKSIHPLDINTSNNHYNRLNECNNIKKMLKTNCTGKALNKAATRSQRLPIARNRTLYLNFLDFSDLITTFF